MVPKWYKQCSQAFALRTVFSFSFPEKEARDCYIFKYIIIFSAVRAREQTGGQFHRFRRMHRQRENSACVLAHCDDRLWRSRPSRPNRPFRWSWNLAHWLIDWFQKTKIMDVFFENILLILKIWCGFLKIWCGVLKIWCGFLKFEKSDVDFPNNLGTGSDPNQKKQ